MLALRKSSERGTGDHGWLKSHHSFSFANYYDPAHMGFRSLRVINEDFIAGGTGFGEHPHRDMEIITYVTHGALEHRDSMGNRAVIRPGEVQRMSAGTGVVHAEFNASPSEEVHLFQIWIHPNVRGGAPGYGQKSFAEQLAREKMVLVVSGDGRDGSIAIQQDADLHLSRLPAGGSLEFRLRPQRGAWLHLASGELTVNGQRLVAGDAVAVTDGERLQIEARAPSEFMLFDLA